MINIFHCKSEKVDSKPTECLSIRGHVDVHCSNEQTSTVARCANHAWKSKVWVRVSSEPCDELARGRRAAREWHGHVRPQAAVGGASLTRRSTIVVMKRAGSDSAR